MDEILRQPVARPAESCMPVDSRGSDDGVSFLDHVIAPLYGVVSAVCSLKFFFHFTFSTLHVHGEVSSLNHTLLLLNKEM